MNIFTQLIEDLKSNKLTAALTLIFAFTLSACTNTPTHIIVAPQLINTTPYTYKLDSNKKQLNFVVIDNRVASHVVQILRANQAAQLFSSQKHLKNTVSTTLRQAFKTQGLVLSINSNTEADMNKLTVYIDAALISVQQEALKYKANNEIILRAVVSNKAQTLTKTFTTKGNSNGPLSADLAVLERDFNQQLGKLLVRILNNTELRAAIN